MRGTKSSSEIVIYPAFPKTVTICRASSSYANAAKIALAISAVSTMAIIDCSAYLNETSDATIYTFKPCVVRNN